MNRSPNDSSLPQVLASDADREKVQIDLKRACLDGRLTLDEYSHRLDLLALARTPDQLSDLVVDLPARGATSQSRAIVSRPRRATTVAILSSVERTGSRWLTGQTHRAIALMGECKLDLREVGTTSQETIIQARILMGSLEIRVPEGVVVELDVLTLMGEAKSRLSGPPPAPDARVIRITGLAVMGSLQVKDGP